MANEVVGIDVVAHLDKLRKEFAAIPKVADDETKALTAVVNKNIKALEKEIARAGKASRVTKVEVDGLARSTKDFGDKAGKTGQNASKLAGAVGLISPAAAEAVRTIADLADVGEVAADIQGALGLSSVRLAAVLGPVAIAVGVVAAAYLYLSNEAEKANKRVEESAERATAAQVAHERLSKMRLSAADAEALATGKVSESDLKLRDALAAVTAEHAPRIAAVRAQIAEQDALAASNAAIVASGKGVGAQVQAASNAQRAASAEAKRLRGELVGLEEAQGRVIDSTVVGVKFSKEDVKVKGDQVKAARALAAETLSFEDQVSALRERLAAEEIDRQTAMRESINAMTIEQQEVNARMDAERVASARAAADAQIEESRRVLEERRAQEQAELAATSDLYGSIVSIATSAGDAMNEKDKSAKAAAFAIQRAGAIGQVALNAAIGISEATASAAPPANIPAIIAATGQGIANGIAVAAVPAPAFNDTPGVQQMGTRGNVSLGAGDFFAAARDPEDLRRQVNGATDPHADYRTGGPQVSVIGARAFGRRIRDDVRMRTPLARVIFSQSGRVVGQAGRR